MREPTEDEIHIKSRLLYLFNETYGDEKSEQIDLVKEFIEVGEWGLAADTMAFEYLPGKRPIANTMRNIFVDLDERMKLSGQRWYPSMAALVSDNPK